MSIEALLDLLRNKFTAAEGQIILESLVQDPLVWQFAQNTEASVTYANSASKSISSFSPGAIALWLIEQEIGVPIPSLADTSIKLPDPIRQKGAKVFQTVLNTGLAPMDLINAGFLALTLRERYIIKNSWEGIASEICKNQDESASLKHFRVWRTPVACLRAFCPSSFDQFILDFTQSKSTNLIEAAIPLFIHAVLSNPSESKEKLDNILQFSKTLSTDYQLRGLQWLNCFERDELRRDLARHLMQTRENQTNFAHTFSEIESLSINEDPLENPIKVDLPHRLSRLAAFHFHAGNKEKAIEVYQDASDIASIIQKQALYQSLALQGKGAPNSGWLKLIQSLPASKQSKARYIQSLIDSNNFEEAQRQIEELPNSTIKTLLTHTIKVKNVDSLAEDEFPLTALDTTAAEKSPPKIISHVSQPYMESPLEIFEVISSISDSKKRLKMISELLENNINNKELLYIARDEYENNGWLKRAIELVSFLSVLEPEEQDHKSVLARLYCKSERWQDAFELLQKVISTSTDPNVEDLTFFAEAALETKQVDLAISICQNILKQEKDQAKALVLLGKGYFQKGDSVKAIQHMEQVVEKVPNDPQTWITLAKFWENAGQIDRSFEVLRQANIALPDNPELLTEIGRAHLESASPADAVVYLRKAFGFNPESHKIRRYLSEAEYELGEYKKALGLIEPFSEEYPKDPALAHLLGKILLSLGRRSEAVPILLSAAQQNPAELDAVIKASDLVLANNQKPQEPDQENNLKQIEDILISALEIRPGNAELKLRQADLDMNIGHYEKAFDAYTELTKHNQIKNDLPEWRLQFGLGQAALGLGDLEVGLAALQDAALNKPDELIILHALSKAYADADLMGKAYSTAKSAMKLAPQDVENILWYAHFNIDTQQPDEAIKALKDALQITADCPRIKYLLAKTQLSANEKSEAKALLNDLLSSSQITPAELHHVGYLFVQLQELDQAAKAIESAIEKSEDLQPIMMMELALIYTQLNQRKKALEILNTEKDEVLRDFPPLSILKSDLLSQLGQFKIALATLRSAEENIEPFFKSDNAYLKQLELSPLMFGRDFSHEGYLNRLGQIFQATGNIEDAKSTFAKVLDIAPDDVKLRNAAVNANIAGLDFENAEKIAAMTSFEKGASFGIDLIDLMCTHIELKLKESKTEESKTLLKKYEISSEESPRIAAIESQIAALEGNNEVAQAKLAQAVEIYHRFIASATPDSLSERFRLIFNLWSLAESTWRLKNYQAAQKYFHEAWMKLNNQPSINVRYLELLIESAEEQQVSQVIKITHHAPGHQFLSEENRHLAETLLESAETFIGEKDLSCLRARLISAFTGIWPLHLNVESCLDSPKLAAAIIMGSDEGSLADDIVSAYPHDLVVLQARAIFALKSGMSGVKDIIEKALEINTTDPINHALLGFANINQPNFALKSFENALNLWPEEADWHKIAADLYAKLGEHNKAAEHISQAINLNPQNDTYLQTRADIHIQTNNLEKAKVDLERSAEIQTEDASCWIKMADVNRRLGNLKEAEANIKNAVEICPNDNDIATFEIKFLLDQNKYQAAVEKAEELLEKNNQDKTIRILLAQSKAKLGDFDGALRTLSEGQKSHSTIVEMQLETIKIKKDRDGIEGALPELIRLAQEFPEHSDTLETLTDWLIQTNRLKQAEETAQTILRIIPDHARVHLMLGRLQRLNGQLDQAIKHLSDAIAYDPNLVEAYIELGKTYQDRRDLEEAIKVYQLGSKVDASDARPYFFAGMALKDCKDYPNAEVMLKLAKRYAPGDANIIRQLGVVTALNLINNLREAR